MIRLNNYKLGSMAKIYEYRRPLKWIAGCVIVYLLFHKVLEYLFSKYIVIPFFTGIEAVWYNDLVFMLILIYCLVTFFSKKVFSPPAPVVIIAVSFISIIYLFYRFVPSAYILTPFSLMPIFKYGDVLVIFSILQWRLTIQRVEKNQITKDKDSFDSDQPIGESGEDLLGYSRYAEALAKKILVSHSEKSFAIGINGKWGIGKTSFLNLLKRKIKGDDIIEINFNPWNSHTPQAIIRDFFNTVEEKIREQHSEIAGELVNYANKLVSINDSSLSKSVQSSISVAFGYDSLNSLHETINRLLKQWEKKIVVYIDDLDRLDSSEIVEVIRLIRNTADFYNTIFIACYDKQYIIEALKGHNAYNHSHFLEKIFQLEVNLPYFKKEILKKILAKKLKEAFAEVYHEDIDIALSGNSLVRSVDILAWVESMRDVTRFANSIKLNLTPLLGDVEIKDFIQLEILRLRYPLIYEMLFRQKSLFLQVDKEEGVKNRKYVLRRGKDIPQYIKQNDTSKNEKYIRLYLETYHESLQIPKSEVEQIVDMIETIFPDSLGHYRPTDNFLSVVYLDNFDRYFAYNLLEGNLSNTEFKAALDYDLDGLKKQIDAWLERGLGNEVQKSFMQISEFKSKEMFEKIILAIFYLSNKQSEISSLGYLGYDGKDLMEKMADYYGKVADFYGDNGKAQLHDFVEKVLLNADSPYRYESQFVAYVNNKMLDDTMFILSQDELKAIALYYLQQYCEAAVKIDLTAFNLFWRTEQTEFISVGGNSYRKHTQYPQEAKEIMKALIAKDLNEFIESIIEPESLHQKTFAISSTASLLYDSWELFKEHLNREDEDRWTYLKEFKEFFQIFEKNRFEKYVDFDFKVIPVYEKLRKK